MPLWPWHRASFRLYQPVGESIDIVGGARDMARSYEELVGGLGRTITYRPERHLAHEILAGHAATLVVDDSRFQRTDYRVHDMSMSGVSFAAPEGDAQWRLDAEVDVRIYVDEAELYRGTVRVARTEKRRGSIHVGVELVDRFLDLPEIRAEYEERSLEKDLMEGPEVTRRAVPPAYREVVEEAAHFLSFYRQSLHRHEERYRELTDRDAAEKLVIRATDRIRRPWQDLCQRGARTLDGLSDDNSLVRIVKKYTETLITPMVMDSPVLHRSYTKPLGYAGDYQIMSQIYRNSYDGEAVFGKAIHKLSCEEPLAAGVRTRKDLIRNIIAAEHLRVISEGDGAVPRFRVTSIGSGLAREVSEYIGIAHMWPGQAHWTLVDQEEQVLSLSYQEIRRAVHRWNAHATIQCMYMSFLQFLRDPSSLPLRGAQQLIYSVGLFDYLKSRSARKLIRALYSRLAPGGLLAIGNALWPNEHFWVTEFVVDWTLIYRTREEMLALAQDLTDYASIDVVPEASGAYYFLLVRKQP